MNTNKTTLYRVEVSFKGNALGLRYTTDNLEWAHEEAEDMLQYRKSTKYGCLTIRKADILTDDLEELEHDYDSEVLDEDFLPKENLVMKIEWTNNEL